MSGDSGGNARRSSRCALDCRRVRIAIFEHTAFEILAVVIAVFAHDLHLLGLAAAVFDDGHFRPDSILLDEARLSDYHHPVRMRQLPADGEPEWHHPEGPAETRPYEDGSPDAATYAQARPR